MLNSIDLATRQINFPIFVNRRCGAQNIENLQQYHKLKTEFIPYQSSGNFHAKWHYSLPLLLRSFIHSLFILHSLAHIKSFFPVAANSLFLFAIETTDIPTIDIPSKLLALFLHSLFVVYSFVQRFVRYVKEVSFQP